MELVVRCRRGQDKHDDSQVDGHASQHHHHATTNGFLGAALESGIAGAALRKTSDAAANCGAEGNGEIFGSPPLGKMEEMNGAYMNGIT